MDAEGKSKKLKRRYNRGAIGTNPFDKSFKATAEGVVEVLGGDELQTLQVVWRDTDKHFLSAEDVWSSIRDTLNDCDKIMLQHGWDRKVEGEREFPGDRNSEPFSDLWYAGKIGAECWNMLNFHKEMGINPIAVSQAIYLGQLLAEFEWRRNHKPSIVRGQKVAGGAKNSAKKSNKRHEPLRKKRFARMSELVPEMGVDKAACQCETEGLGGWQAIRRQWDRFKEKPDT